MKLEFQNSMYSYKKITPPNNGSYKKKSQNLKIQSVLTKKITPPNNGSYKKWSQNLKIQSVLTKKLPLQTMVLTKNEVKIWKFKVSSLKNYPSKQWFLQKLKSKFENSKYPY